MMIKKRLAAGLTALCFIAGAVCEPVAELGLNAFGNDVVASADRVDGFAYKSEDIFVADSMLQQATLPDGTKYFQHTPVLAYDPTTREWVFKQLAEEIIDDPSNIVTDTFWINMEKSLDLDFVGKDNIFSWQQLMYETLIMDYLKYTYSSADYKDDFEKSTVKYMYEIEKTVLDSEVLDEEAFANKVMKMSHDEAKAFTKEQKYLDSFNEYDVEVYDTLIDSAETVLDYFKSVSEMMALKEANDGRIEFLNQVKARTTDNHLKNAIDDVLANYEKSMGQLALEKFAEFRWKN